MSRVLVVYFSRTGYTKTVAEGVATRCGADVEAVRERRSRGGGFGYLRSAREALKREPAEILPPLHDVKDYDVVLFGTPVWAGHVSSPMRACLGKHGASLRRVAFFCTQHGSGAEKVLEEMAEVCGKRPEATLVLKDSEIRKDSFELKLDSFIHALELPAAA
jgi:flavodoxin